MIHFFPYTTFPLFLIQYKKTGLNESEIQKCLLAREKISKEKIDFSQARS